MKINGNWKAWLKMIEEKGYDVFRVHENENSVTYSIEKGRAIGEIHIYSAGCSFETKEVAEIVHEVWREF